MREAERIAELLRRAYAGDAWHGAAVRQMLEDVDGRTAAARPVEGAHSIGELARHLTVWLDVVRRRLGGERIDWTTMTEEEDWPPFPGDGDAEAAWAEARAELERAHAALVAAAAGLKDDALGERPYPETATRREMLLGTVQHLAHHGGQVALLRKAAGRG